MKELISQYGTAILATIITSTLLLLFMTLHSLNREGIGGGIGDVYDAAVGDCLTGGYNGDQAELYQERSGIYLTVKDEVEIKAGEEFSLSDKVTGLDAEGNTIRMKATKITDADGDCFYGRDENGETYLCLEEPGIYTVWITAKDANGIWKDGYVKIPVQPA